MISVGVRLRQLREAAGFTQEALGERVGVRGATISRYESGRTQIDADFIPVLARVLRVHPGDFFTVPPEQRPPTARGQANTLKDFYEREAQRSQGPDQPSYADIVTQELVRGWKDLPEEDQELVWEFVEARRQLKERLEAEEGKGE